MFAKVHPAEDVKSGNTGSCHDLVRYLEKETGEGQRFFSHTEQDISPERVIMDIDGNKKALGANDAKFFMLSLNPSQSEQMHLIGRKVDDFKELTPQEKKEVFQKLEAFTRSAMDEYALNFGRDNIRGGQDLMYYARVETERSYHPEDEEVKQGITRIGEPKPGLNLHVHVIVSRKSLDGKVKLSPGAKSAGNTWELEGRGTVKRGFSHEGWKVRVQECFNRKFDYQAKEGETYVRPQVSAEIGKITNPELKRILQDEQFTAANQIVAAMREQGYTHQVRKGVHSFSREGEVFQVEHRLLKAFEQPLSDEQLKSITERFDLTKYEANPAGYRENGLQVKDISFSTYVKDEAQKGEKALKEVAYKVVYDEQNHTTVSFATVRQFAYEHQINLVKSEPTAEAVLKKIKNPELKNLLENYRFTSANQIVVAMKEQGPVMIRVLFFIRMTMSRTIQRICLFLFCLPVFGSCMKWDYGEMENFSASASGLFITNEGNFQYSNATLSYYDPATCEVENEVFYRANGFKLGDVAQSMVIRDGIGWIVVNNSHVIFAIDINTFKEVGRITGFTSPRYIHFLSDEKAYVTQIWDYRIFIINPKTYEITGYIECPDMDMESGSTEQMVQYGKYVYVNCWSYQNRILKIDTETDKVVDELTIGIQPTSLVMDKYNKMWTITDGGYEGSPYGYEAPSLYRIDAETFTVEKQFKFKLGDWPSEVQLNGTRDTLYWINNDIWRMPVEADRVPVRPFLEFRDTKYYGLTVNPNNGEVYVADAIDYQQQGIVYRYSPQGKLIDEFYVGIIPGAFCWK